MHEIVASAFVDGSGMQAVAWVVTIISGLASLVITFRQFGLPRWKLASLAGGVFVLGLAVVLAIKSDPEGVGGITDSEIKQVQVLAGEFGEYSAGYQKTQEGFATKPLRGEVRRVSQYIYAVVHPDGQIDAIYSGDYFNAMLDGNIVRCELVALDHDRILIVKNDTESEIIDLMSGQEKGVFKVKRIAVPSPA